MKVLLVTAEYPPMVGGVGDYTRRLAQELACRDVEVAVLTSSGARLAEPGVQVLPDVPRWDFRLFRLVRQVIAQERPDAVHIQYQTAAYGMHPAINLLPGRLRRTHPGLPVVTTFHDLREPYLFPKAGPLRGWVTRRLVLDSSGVITTNPEDAAKAAKTIGRDAKSAPDVMLRSSATKHLLGESRPFARRTSLRVTISRTFGRGLPTAQGTPHPQLTLVPLAPSIDVRPLTDADRWRIRELWGLPEDVYAMGHVGLLNTSKGVEDVLRAARLLKDRGVAARLIMLGEELGDSDQTNRAYRTRLLRLAEDLDVVSDITWTRYLPSADMSRALQSLDCCLLPYVDGASYRRTTLLTALAHGLPVVTTQPSRAAQGAGMPRLQDGDHCLLVPPGDAESLAEAAARVLADNTLRQRLSAGAREMAGHFTWDAVAAKTIHFYQQVTGL